MRNLKESFEIFLALNVGGILIALFVIGLLGANSGTSQESGIPEYPIVVTRREYGQVIEIIDDAASETYITKVETEKGVFELAGAYYIDMLSVGDKVQLKLEYTYDETGGRAIEVLSVTRPLQ